VQSRGKRGREWRQERSVDGEGGIGPGLYCDDVEGRGDGDDGSGGRPVQPEDDRLRKVWLLEIGGRRVGLTHAMPIPEIPPNITVAGALERLFPEQRPDVVVYGDSHVEAIDVMEGVLCVNPGSPTYPHNLNTQLGTIGFLDLADGEPAASIWRLTDSGIAPFDWRTWRR